ncbi:hypothetical protein QF039_003516 [Pseudomonas sp. W2I6]|nr:hypothetical protein [Pseudomonas sp. W2I6]
MASAQPTSMLPDPPLSQPRRGSTAPTFDLHAHLDPHAPGAGMSPKAQQAPVWELSSFSEAAMASAQPTSMLPDPPLSQPRRGSTAPTFDLHAHLDPHAPGAGMSPKAQQAPVWELSSFSEAAMTSAQPTSMLPDPPLSQPRRGSTAPTLDLHAHLDPHAPCAGMSPKAQQAPVWELSSFSEAAMASAQPTSMLPDPPLSQPRRGSTAPTFDLHALSECAVGMTMEKRTDED